MKAQWFKQCVETFIHALGVPHSPPELFAQSLQCLERVHTAHRLFAFAPFCSADNSAGTAGGPGLNQLLARTLFEALVAGRHASQAEETSHLIFLLASPDFSNFVSSTVPHHCLGALIPPQLASTIPPVQMQPLQRAFADFSAGDQGEEAFLTELHALVHNVRLVLATANANPQQQPLA
jgi:hypothetical protein